LAGNQHQVHGLRQLMLMQAKAFAQEPPGAITHNCVAEFTSGDNPKARTRGGF
jgi:hypothetical protein